MTRRHYARLARCLLCVFFLGFVVLAQSAAAQAAQDRPLRLLVGTSLIEDIVRDLTGGQSEMLTLVQGSSCPGHDNSKTKDFIFAARADMVLVHAFQRKMPLLAEMLAAVDNAAVPLVVLEGKGSWLVPDNQKKAVLDVGEALKKALPGQAEVIEARIQARLAKVDRLAAQCRAALAPVQGKKVLAAEMQAEFAAWAGFVVARTHGRAEDLSAKALADSLKAVQGMSISGVIDNYQSGADAGLPLALELGVAHVTLSNFPGSDESVPDYFALLQANVAKLAKL